MHSHQLLLLSRDHARYRELLTAAGLPGLAIAWSDKETGLPPEAATAEIVLGEPALLARYLPQLPQLAWAQSTFAGVDALMAPGLRQDYQLTNVRGVFGPLMSEYVFAHLLSLTRHLPLYRQQQQQHQWQTHPYRPLASRRMLILGTGDIGQHLAATARHFGMQVIGVNRSGRDVAGFDDIYQLEALPRLLPEADVVVSVLPATRETHHLLSADLLACCRSDAVLFNVGRGDVVAADALFDALQQGRPAVAVMDVFEEEPLPRHHPLWTRPNVIITPHNAAWSLPEQVVQIFSRNYLRWQAGESLLYGIDFTRGY